MNAPHAQVIQVTVPRPVERRTEQLNIRLRPSERERLAQQAQAAGYASESEYVRDALAALAHRP